MEKDYATLIPILKQGLRVLDVAPNYHADEKKSFNKVMEKLTQAFINDELELEINNESQDLRSMDLFRIITYLNLK